MDLNQVPSAQLDALRRLLNDETLRSTLLSQLPGLGAQNSGSSSTANNGHAQAAFSTLNGTPSDNSLNSPPYDLEVDSVSRPSGKRARRGGNVSGPSYRSSTSRTAPPPKPNGNLSKAGNQKPTPKRKSKAKPKPVSGATGPVVVNYADAIRAAGAGAGPSRRKFVIGLDYGTTFTSVSYYALDEDDDEPMVFPGQVGIIRKWPHDSMHGVNMQVPTESWYSSVPNAREPTSGQFDNGDSDYEYEDTPGLEVAHPSRLSPTAFESSLDHEASLEYLWGYEVPYQRYREYSTRDPTRHIERAKLMLVNSEHTVEDRQNLGPRLKHLIDRGIIRKFGTPVSPDPRDVQDVITDFMVKILEHTRKQLETLENYNSNNCSVSFALTVPTIWSARSSRILQFALEDAIKTTGFGNLTQGSVDNLFVVSEPEAAATYLLGNSRDMLAGETFVVMDCGGGTVDGSTYTVTNTYPLRLDQEVLLPTGDNCGASYLNENFQALLMEKLADEHYLEANGDTLESIVKSLVPNFEDFDKRNKDISKSPSSRLRIPGLKSDHRQSRPGRDPKGFEDNYLLLYPDDYDRIFKPLLRRTRDVLKTQLESARLKGKSVQKVFLIGGFGAAPSLRYYLKMFLTKYSGSSRTLLPIELILSDEQTCVTAVSSGAVLRAMNIRNGPIREAHSSYGFLRIQPYQPQIIKSHKDAAPMIDQLDGEAYVTVIHYFMLKGMVIDPVHTFKPLVCTHAFPTTREQLLCEEVIYVNDDDTKSHYSIDHHLNQGAQVAGKIVTDMTFLRDQGKIVPTYPEMQDGVAMKGQIHYEIQYDLVIVVEGRNLRYEARYPSGSSGKTLKSGQISIAAAFKPGTG